MLYSTLVDKSEATMNLLIARAEEFDQDRVLDGLDTRHYSVMEVRKMTAFVTEHLARMQQELLALQEFAQDFNRQYATDNNACYDTAARLFSQLRSSIACTRRMYKKFCPRTRRPAPRREGVEEHPSVFDRSLLATSSYSLTLFGTQTYDTCVDELCQAMEQFFAGLVIAMKLCRDVMQQERAIRRDAHRVRSIYDECYRRVLDEAGSLITMLQQTNGWQPDEMTRRKTATPSDDALLCDRFHTMTKSDFQRHAVTDHLSRGRHAGLTDVESLLWNNDREQVARVRQAIAHFDEVEPAGQHDRATGRQKLSSTCVAMLMQWCHITASAPAAPPTPGASPATSAEASGPSAAPAATPTRDERIAAAIADVMELKDEQGDYLFQYVRQWQGIYRVLADRGIVRAGDYKGFTDYIAAIHPAPLRLPPDAKSLSKTDLGLLAKPYKDWASSRYDGTRTTYQRYALIAQAFATRLDALGD